MSQLPSPEDFREPQWYIDQQDIRPNMTCGTCKRDLWDCRCPQRVECKYCEGSQEDEMADPQPCRDAPDGIHYFESADVEP